MRRQRPWDESMLDVLSDADEDYKQLVRDLAANGAGEFTWRAAVYDRAEQSDIAWTALLGIEAALLARTKDRKDWSTEYAALAEAARALGTFKHWAFKDEEETRIVCDASMQAELMYLKHRLGRYGMTQYVELGVPEDHFREPDDSPEPMARLPIHGVVIGPARDQASAQADVRELLRSNGHKDASIMLSPIPFRS